VPLFKQLSVVALVASLLQSAPAPTPTSLDTFLRSRVGGDRVPGVVVMVVNREKAVYTGAFGEADVARKRPMRSDSIFRIASMTKPVTSLAIMMLVEQGQLGLDDLATKYLPDLSNMKVLTAWHDADGSYESRPPRRPITIRDLLTHTSGIAYSFVDPHLAKLDDGQKGPINLPMVSDPGERFVYGPNTALLGEIVSKVAHVPFDEFFATRIFKPLGMVDTFYVVPADKIDRVVTMHTRTSDGVFHESPNPPAISSPTRGDGGLLSTAADYARFMQLFLNRGRAGSRQLVSERTIEMMTSNQIGSLRVGQQPSTAPAFSYPFPLGAGKDSFGFGFQIEERPAVAGLRSAGSLSWGGIQNTHFWIDRQRSIAAVVLMQFLPYYDPLALDLLRGFERDVYAAGLH
jgi:CubicO group peptidase (beta-lactamase class C family)